MKILHQSSTFFVPTSTRTHSRSFSYHSLNLSLWALKQLFLTLCPLAQIHFGPCYVKGSNSPKNIGLKNQMRHVSYNFKREKVMPSTVVCHILHPLVATGNLSLGTNFRVVRGLPHHDHVNLACSEHVFFLFFFWTCTILGNYFSR